MTSSGVRPVQSRGIEASDVVIGLCSREDFLLHKDRARQINYVQT